MRSRKVQHFLAPARDLRPVEEALEKGHRVHAQGPDAISALLHDQGVPAQGTDELPVAVEVRSP